MTRFVPAALLWAATILAAAVPGVRADAEYSITDGAAEIALSIDPGETMVWMNTFAVDPAGPYIDAIRVAYGRVGGPSPLNGQAVKILLYDDLDGGDPKNALLKWSLDTTMANANTNLLNVYAVPSVRIRGHLVVAAYYRNTTPIPMFPGALDTTAPTYAARSYYGWAVALDPSNLGAIPADQWGPIESTGTSGNVRIEARGRSAPQASAISLEVEPVRSAGLVRLQWTGSQLRYDVERASRPDFSDAQVIAPAVPGPLYDDPVLGDGGTWFYRVY